MKDLLNKEESERIALKPDEQIEDLHRNGFKIIQDSKRFKFGIDAVLLSQFAVVRKKQTVIDLGTGNGIIPILLAATTEAEHITGLEIQKESFELAEKSIKLNNAEERISVVNGDIKKVSEYFSRSCVDVVTSNPPYMIDEHGVQNKDSYKSIARHEVLCNLEDVVKAAFYLLKPCGVFYMIHRPFRISEICVTLSKYKLEPKRMRFVQSFNDEPPSMVLIEARKDAKPRVEIEKPLIVYKEKGIYTEEIDRLYGRI